MERGCGFYLYWIRRGVVFYLVACSELQGFLTFKQSVLIDEQMHE